MNGNWAVAPSVEVLLTSPGEILSRAISKHALCGKQAAALVNGCFSCSVRRILCLLTARLCAIPSCALMPSETQLATILLLRNRPVPSLRQGGSCLSGKKWY